MGIFPLISITIFCVRACIISDFAQVCLLTVGRWTSPSNIETSPISLYTFSHAQKARHAKLFSFLFLKKKNFLIYNFIVSSPSSLFSVSLFIFFSIILATSTLYINSNFKNTQNTWSNRDHRVIVICKKSLYLFSLQIGNLEKHDNTTLTKQSLVTLFTNSDHKRTCSKFEK